MTSSYKPQYPGDMEITPPSVSHRPLGVDFRTLTPPLERMGSLDTPTPQPLSTSLQREDTAIPLAQVSAAKYNVIDSDAEHQMVAVDLHKSYRKGKLIVPVLKGVQLYVRRGELLSIVGQSGSGKSTLLHLLGTLDVPDTGTIHFDGQRIDNISRRQRDILRNRFFGMIFQFYHLLPELTALENVLSPLMIRHGVFSYLGRRREHEAKATAILQRVGLGHRLRHKPSELSGGEMQRAAIARALITDPHVLLADEPTGNLDATSATGVLELLRQLNHEHHLTIVMVTHDIQIAKQSDRILCLLDGKMDGE